MKTIVLKVDVDTLRGTQIGVPQLSALFQRYQAHATFLFSLGKDHTGRAIKRIFRPGFFQKVSRTSVLEHYGIRTLLNGTLLPGPDIGRRCASILRATADAGFEVGIHCWDHVRWQDHVVDADEAWTQHELNQAIKRFEEIFGHAVKTHGAAGWQMNAAAYELEAKMGLHYASDTRGNYPFQPVVNDAVLNCIQMPTTLPTLDELLGLNDTTPENVHERLLAATQEEREYGHVFTLHAELEGMKLLPAMERMLQGWLEQGYQLISMEELYRRLHPSALPKHQVAMSELPGRSGLLAVQGAAVSI